MVGAFSSNNTTVAPTNGNSQTLTMKTNFMNLIHQADLQINGKTVESTQSFVNVAKNFQMLSEMSVGDLATIGPSLGFGEVLDNPRAAKWNANAVNTNSQGFTNNRVTCLRYPSTIQTQINAGTGNDAMLSRLIVIPILLLIIMVLQPL